MKKILLTWTFFLTTSLFAQQGDIEVIIITHYTSESSMVWSESQQDYIYKETEERYRESCLWTIKLINDKTGQILIEYLDDGTKRLLDVYNWRKIEDDDKGIRADFVVKLEGLKGTIIIQYTENSEEMLSIFLPEEELMLTFDNIKTN